MNRRLLLLLRAAFLRRVVHHASRRAHHAEIGGIVPGSMPPQSKNLAEEGVLIRNFRLIAAGRAQFNALSDLLSSGLFPGRAIAARQLQPTSQLGRCESSRGSCNLVLSVEREGWTTVEAYMRHSIQTAAG